MTNPYSEDTEIIEKIRQELRCIRAVLERLLMHLNRSLFVDYQMEKFGEDFKQQK